MYSSKVPPFTVFFENSEEFHLLKREIFTQGVYYFETTTSAPLIIDAGAHIGLAALYFKKHYPQSSIISIEANPANFQLLEKNVSQNHLTDIELHQKALTSKDGKVSFFIDASNQQWLSTGSLQPGAWNGLQTSRAIEVEGTALSRYLQKPINFLKMDIEGAEQAVLLSTGDQIRQVQQMVIEFHPIKGNSLRQVRAFLEQHGFLVEVSQDKKDKGLSYIWAKQR